MPIKLKIVETADRPTKGTVVLSLTERICS